MDRPLNKLEVMYEGMCQVIRNYGGKPPVRNEAGSLNLISDYLLALGCELEMRLVEKPDPQTQPET